MKRAQINESSRDVNTRIAVLSLSPEWLDILAVLSVQPRTVIEIQGELNLKQPTLSHRLKKMAAAGLVGYEELDRGSHLYRLIPESLQVTAQDIRATARRIEETAEKIESFLPKKKSRTA